MNTWRWLFFLVVPHHEHLGEAWYLRDLLDDFKQALLSVVGQHHGGEAMGLGRDQGQEQGVLSSDL